MPRVFLLPMFHGHVSRNFFLNQYKTMHALNLNLKNRWFRIHRRRSSWSSSSSDNDIDILSGLRVFFRSISSTSGTRHQQQQQQHQQQLRRRHLSSPETQTAKDVADSSPTKVRYRTNLSAGDAGRKVKPARPLHAILILSGLLGRMKVHY